jgi:hypothetical protein
MLLRLQVAFQSDTTFPRDNVVITPHFETKVDPTPNADQLCEDLATALSAWQAPTAGRQVVVRAYDAQGTPPVFPIGEAIRNLGVTVATASPREVALCLSFYSERNRPRQRGRLYIPFGVSSTGSPGLRPTTTQRQKIADLVPIFTGLGGIDVDWSVYSRTDDTARPVTNWYVDDEWDIVRSRGMRPTARTEGTTTEAAAP